VVPAPAQKAPVLGVVVAKSTSHIVEEKRLVVDIPRMVLKKQFLLTTKTLVRRRTQARTTSVHSGV